MIKLFVKILLYLILFFSFEVKCHNLPKISIITSLYKGGLFIKGFLDDITKQTIFKECELIIIDANSPDNEEFIIKPFIDKYSNITYKKLKKTIGIYQAWNIAINLAKGEYITNANVDDRLSPFCYKTHSRILDRNPNVDLVYSNSYETCSPNKLFKNCYQNKIIKRPEFSKKQIKTNCLPGFNPMWRKSMHTKYGLFDESLSILGDSEFWIRAISNGSLFKKVNGIYGLYYNNPIGLSTNKKNKPLIYKEWDYINKKHQNFFKK